MAVSTEEWALIEKLSRRVAVAGRVPRVCLAVLWIVPLTHLVLCSGHAARLHILMAQHALSFSCGFFPQLDGLSLSEINQRVLGMHRALLALDGMVLHLLFSGWWSVIILLVRAAWRRTDLLVRVYGERGERE